MLSIFYATAHHSYLRGSQTYIDPPLDMDSVIDLTDASKALDLARIRAQLM
jgi:hypothetical protein